MTKGMEPAFPEVLELKEMSKEGGDVRYYRGLTKREYFAGLAMQGLISSLTMKKPEDIPATARLSIAFADALIAELSKGDK